MEYRRDIDGLRAVAVLSVLIYHAFPGILPGGFIGVDIFFVISGYLISNIIREELVSGTFSIRQFYARRIRRILPALLIVLFFCLLSGWLILLPEEYKQLAKHITSATTFTSNFRLLSESGYFDAEAEMKPLLHLWSLAIEEQFYIIWPLIIGTALKFRSKSLTLIILLAATSFLVNLESIADNINLAFYGPAARFWELMLGGMIAFLPKNATTAAQREGNKLGVIGILLLVIGFAFINNQRAFPGFWALLPTTGALLIILGGENSTLTKSTLSTRPLSSIGKISYPLYLWHWPLLSFLYICTGQASTTERALALALAFILASATYIFAERKIRYIPGRGVVTTLVATLLITLFMARVVDINNGFPKRSPAVDSAINVNEKDFEKTRFSDGSCENLPSYSPLEREVCFTQSKKPVAMFFGDSHAIALYSAIQRGTFNANAMLLASHGCEMYLGIKITHTKAQEWGNNCSLVMERGLNLLNKMPFIKDVILAQRMPSFENPATKYSADGKDTSAIDAFIQGTNNLISQIEGMGRRTILVLDTPTLKLPPSRCIQRVSFLHPQECRRLAVDFEVGRAPYLEAIRDIKAKHPNLMIYDPKAIFCGGHICRAQLSGKYLYFDDNHITDMASKIILEDMKFLMDKDN